MCGVGRGVVGHNAGEREIVESRKCERRWREAGFFLIERRAGGLRKHGTILLAVALWAIIAWLYLG